MEFNNSRLQQYLSCPRSFLHRYLKKMTTKKKPHFFVLGESIHKFIEMFYRTKDPKLALRQIETIFQAASKDTALLSKEEVHELECDKQMALGIGEVYPEFYGQDFDTYDKFLTEQTFKLPLGDTGHTYFGTLDALLQDHAGDWWILETKTAAPSTVNQDYFERIKIDSQVAGYMHGAKQLLGDFPKGIVYNVIKKTAIRLKAGETYQAFQRRVHLEYKQFAKEKAYFTREELMVSTARLGNWLDDTIALVTFLADRIQGKSRHWHMNTGNCRANYGVCPFMNACVTGTYSPLLYTKDTSGK